MQCAEWTSASRKCRFGFTSCTGSRTLVLTGETSTSPQHRSTDAGGVVLANAAFLGRALRPTGKLCRRRLGDTFGADTGPFGLAPSVGHPRGSPAVLLHAVASILWLPGWPGCPCRIVHSMGTVCGQRMASHGAHVVPYMRRCASAVWVSRALAIRLHPGGCGGSGQESTRAPVHGCSPSRAGYKEIAHSPWAPSGRPTMSLARI